MKPCGRILKCDMRTDIYNAETSGTIITDKGLKVDAFALSDPEDIMGVNDQEQLKSAAEIIRRRNQAK